MKSVLLIGLGRFGRHMAQKLHELHHEVMAVDREETRVNAALDYVTNGLIGDTTNPEFLHKLGVRNFDLCVVAIGDDFQSSLETTSLLKEQGARLVLARATQDIHARLLLRNGADQIVYPEKQSAGWAAVRFTSDNITDYIEITPNYSVYETAVPSDWVGKSVGELELRKKYKINVLGTKKGDALEPLPGAEHVFTQDENVLILGSNRDIERYLHT